MTTRNAAINVLLDHSAQLLCVGMGTLLSACLDIRISLRLSNSSIPYDVIVTDYTSGLRHLERVNTAGRSAIERVLIVTDRDREWDVRLALLAGVKGYISEHCSSGDLVEAVRSVSNGQLFISDDLLTCVTAGYGMQELTQRESAVLNLLARGCCNKTIARELGIGIGTVKAHMKCLFTKLGATARTHAVVLATRRGLVNTQ